jgi:hypothetical protein
LSAWSSGARGQVGERLGHRSGRDQLRAHLRYVPDIALSAPIDELRDELMELRGPKYVRRDPTGQRDSFVSDLGGTVAGGLPIGADDRDDDEPLDSRGRTNLLEVSGRGGEELGGGALIGPWSGGRVDDHLRPGQGCGQAVAGDHVDTASARYLNGVVSTLGQGFDNVPADPPGRSGNCNLHDRNSFVPSSNGWTLVRPERAAERDVPCVTFHHAYQPASCALLTTTWRGTSWTI